MDKWPFIPEYMEIEGKDGDSVRKMLEILDINSEQVTTMDVDSIYKHYGYNR